MFHSLIQPTQINTIETKSKSSSSSSKLLPFRKFNHLHIVSFPSVQNRKRCSLVVAAATAAASSGGSVADGDAVISLEQCFSDSPVSSSFDFAPSMSGCAGGAVMKGKHGAFGGTATLEKAKFDMSQTTINSMKKKRSSNSSLPEDLVIEILSLLSIKTLLRFKCVCKSWYDLILSSSFISMHRVNSNHHRLILGHKVPPYHFRVLSCNTIDVISEDHRFYEHNCPLWSYQRLLGSYNGVVCLANEFEGTVALWNPATGRYKIANQSSINETSERIRWKYAPDTPVSIERLYAFGYDFKTDDYKVMSFITIRTDRIFPNHINEIYSFNTGSWTSSNAVIPRGLYFPSYPYSRPRPRACVNGIYSTIACSRQPEEIEEYARKAYKSFLFTVDMSNDKFITTHMPREAAICEVILRRWKEGSRVLTQVNESVTLVVRTPERKQIWVYTLNEYGPDGIWTRLYTIAPLYELLSNSYIDGFWRNKLILQKPEHCSGDLLLCDPKTHEVEMVEIRSEYYQILEYKESWSWPLD